MKKHILILVLFALALLPAVAQTPNDKAALLKLRQAVTQAATDTGRVKAWLAVSAWYWQNATEQTTYLDSAQNYTNQAEQLSIKTGYQAGIAQSWLMYGELYLSKGDTKQSVNWATKVAARYKEPANSHWLADAYVLLGDNIPDSEKISAAKVSYFKQAIRIYEQLGDKRAQAKVCIKLGNVYLMGGQYQVMIDLLNQAGRLYEPLNYPEKDMDMEWLYERFEYAYLGKDDYTQALKYALQSVRIIEKYHDNSLKAFRIYNNVAFLNSLLKQYDTQAYFLQKALPIARRYEAIKNDSTMVAQVLGNLVVAKLAQRQPLEAIRQLNKIGDRYPHNNLGWRQFINKNYLLAYTDSRQLNAARPYYQAVVKQVNELDPYHAHQTTNYTALIRYLTAASRFGEAYHYLALNDVTCRKNSQVDLLAQNYLAWFRVDSLKGNLNQAISHYQAYKSISDSLMNTQKASQLANLQLAYNTEKKDEAIKLDKQKILLLQKQAQLQQANLLHEKTVRQVAFAGVAMLILLLGIGFNGYRSKQKANLKLEAQQGKINTANTALQHLNDSLRTLLTEKEWLLKEIHHRVKNNLQIVISLLNTQSAYLDNEDALTAIRNSQHRMHAMSLIHQKLYQSDNMAFIDMAVYVRELVDYLQESFNANGRVNIQLDVAAVRFDVSQAVPLGLILNETISNAFKYAFKPGDAGAIHITLQLVDAADDRYMLCVADNGKGLPEGFDPDTSTSLGMSLMQGLAHQLDGEFYLNSNSGLQVCVSFKRIEINNLDTVIA